MIERVRPAFFAALALAAALLAPPAAFPARAGAPAAAPRPVRVAALVRHALPADLARHAPLAGRCDFLTLPSGVAPRDRAAARAEAARVALLVARLVDAGLDPAVEAVRIDRFDPALPTADPARVLPALDGLGFRVVADLRDPPPAAAGPDAAPALAAALAARDRLLLVAPGGDLASAFPDPAAGARLTGEAGLLAGPAVAAAEVAALAAVERERLVDRGHPDPSAALVRAALLARAEYLAPGRYGLGRGRELADRLSAAARFDRSVSAGAAAAFFYRDERRSGAKRRERIPFALAGPRPLRVAAALDGAPGLAFRIRRDDGWAAEAAALPGGRLKRVEATLVAGHDYELVVEAPRGTRPGPFGAAACAVRAAKR